MEPRQLVERTVAAIKAGTLDNFSPLIGLFQYERKPMTLDGHFMFLPMFSMQKPKYFTLECGRQVSKSFTIAETNILMTGMIESYNSVYVAPRYEQLKRFHNQVLNPLLRNCTIGTNLLAKNGSDAIEMKAFANGNTLVLAHSFASADPVRGLSNCASMTCDESQDINPDFLPVFESTTDASRYGIIQCAGTAKTTDTLLEMQFSKSSQCHWGIKCPHCSKWNIASIDEQIIGMIGKDGLSCAYCGKILNPRTGGWIPKFPDRLTSHIGLHVPQIILPMHCENEVKWRVLRSRQSEWGKSKFLNEVLGVASDESIKLLTKNDLINDQNNFDNNLDSAIRNRKLFDTVFIGVDWSGGGGGFSRTAIAAIGRSNGHRESHVFFLETLPHGLTPEEEADRVAAVYSKLRANMIAHDYTGAGFVRESVLLGRHPYLQDKIYPFAYVFRTGSQLVSYADSGSRRSANVDKTRSLLLTFSAVRSKLLMLPKFNPLNNSEPQLELLNIVERPQEFSKASIKEVYILQRAPGRYDDAAHAINIGYIAQCDLTDSWPQFSMDPKYNLSDAQLAELTGLHDEARVY